MKNLIVIPTLNEVNNLDFITNKIFKILATIHILFIDDNSDDGTRKKIRLLRKKNKKIFFIFRNKRLGIGSAHKEGIKWAYKKKYKICFFMDCDRTHNPIILRKMLILFKKNYQIIGTSRFLNKESIKDWSFYRKLLTQMRYTLVKFFLGTNLDSSGGFRAFDLKKVRLSNFLISRNNSYFYLVESMFYFEKMGYKIAEVPVVLNKRVYGSSKMRIKDIFDALISLIILFIKKNFSYK